MNNKQSSKGLFKKLLSLVNDTVILELYLFLVTKLVCSNLTEQAARVLSLRSTTKMAISNLIIRLKVKKEDCLDEII